MTRWPRFLGPGWLAAYAVSGALWLAILGLWGACIVFAMIVGGAFGIIAIGEWIAGGFEMPPPGGWR